MLAAELDEVLGRRTQTESLLTGGGRDALLALRGAVQRLGVRHESAERLLSELQRDLDFARRPPGGPTPAAPGRVPDDAASASPPPHAARRPGRARRHGAWSG